MNCRHCSCVVEHTFLDLGFAPPSNAYLSAEDLRRSELYFPLRVAICTHCWLAQTEDYIQPGDLFSADYAYFSSASKTWMAQTALYVEIVSKRFNLDRNSMVVEVASNDGYLLRNFVAAGIPCLGIEPTSDTADAAERLGVPVLREFFSDRVAAELAAQGKQADLIVGNNVYAHVPDINDFTRGLKRTLKPNGVITLEFPHLLRLLEKNLFDTIYHEHFSYLSLTAVARIFGAFGLRVWDVEELPTQGGSLRVYGCHAEASHVDRPAVAALLEVEAREGLQKLETYQRVQGLAEKVKDDLLVFLIEQKRAGRSVAAYGAAAKGNTLLNFAGVKSDLLPFVCDAAVAKQGRFLPGSHIPILAPAALETRRPDFLLVLPWNIADEVRIQNASLAVLGTRFVLAMPRLEIL